MLKSELIIWLNTSIHESGDFPVSITELIEVCDGPRAINEYHAREEIVRNIVRAKRELRAIGKDFFRDIWPEAKAAMLEKRQRVINSP